MQLQPLQASSHEECFKITKQEHLCGEVLRHGLKQRIDIANYWLETTPKDSIFFTPFADMHAARKKRPHP